MEPYATSTACADRLLVSDPGSDVTSTTCAREWPVEKSKIDRLSPVLAIDASANSDLRTDVIQQFDVPGTWAAFHARRRSLFGDTMGRRRPGKAPA